MGRNKIPGSTLSERIADWIEDHLDKAKDTLSFLRLIALTAVAGSFIMYVLFSLIYTTYDLIFG